MNLTKAQKTEKARRLLHRTPAGKALEGPDHEFVLSVLAKHPRALEKVGSGVKSITVGPGLHGKKAFWIERVDGTRTDFSYLKCLGRVTLDVYKAFRQEILAQVTQARALALGGQIGESHGPWAPTFVCPVTGKVTLREKGHVDHEPPNTFKVLLDRFLALEGLLLTNVQIEGQKDGWRKKKLVDRALAQRWIWFHGKNAKLRLVSVEANLSIVPKAART